MINLKFLSKVMSHALRHEPWLYELELDDEGWVPIINLLSALKFENDKWTNLNESDFHDVINQSSKKRHEIKDGKIRALYGHSTPIKIIKQPAEPPEILFHGTSPELEKVILAEGLKPMARHYVHLSLDIETAKQVASRKSNKPKILVIKSKVAYDNHVQFYRGNEHVWLADCIPPKYIDINQ